MSRVPAEHIAVIIIQVHKLYYSTMVSIDVLKVAPHTRTMLQKTTAYRSLNSLSYSPLHRSINAFSPLLECVKKKY